MSFKVAVLFLLNITLHLRCKSKHAETKSVALEPDKSSQEDASVIVNPNYTGASVTDWWWTIYTQTQIGYALHVSLNNSWGFDSNFVSIMEITIDGENWVGDDQDIDLCIAFSVNDSQYVSLYTRLDNIDNDRIYPNCTTSSITPIGQGNINELVSRDININRGLKSMNNITIDGQYGYLMLPAAPHTINRSIDWPLKYTLRNDPDNDKLIVSFTNEAWQEPDKDIVIQQCVYSSFQTNQGLDIYIAGDDNYENLGIHQITIDYTNGITNSPTLDPTSSPSDNPTVIPSNQPTAMPTTNPTNFPTLTPTRNPSNNPTSQPTTSPTIETAPPSFFPSGDPTIMPSKLPSVPPTTPSPILLDKETKHPSQAPTINPLIETSQAYATEEDIDSSGEKNIHVVIFIVIVLILAFCCLIFASYKVTRRKEIKKQMDTTNNYVALGDMSNDIEGSYDLLNVNSLAPPTRNGDVTTKGEMRGYTISDNPKKQSDSDAVYNYSAPTPGYHDDEDSDNSDKGEEDFEELMENNSDAGSTKAPDPEENVLPAEKDTADKFDQMLQDQCLGNDIMMDDVINDMETDKQ